MKILSTLTKRQKLLIRTVIDIWIIGMFFVIIVGDSLLSRLPDRKYTDTSWNGCSKKSEWFNLDVSCANTFKGFWIETLAQSAHELWFLLILPLFALDRIDELNITGILVTAISLLILLFVLLWPFWILIRITRWILRRLPNRT